MCSKWSLPRTGSPSKPHTLRRWIFACPRHCPVVGYESRDWEHSHVNGVKGDIAPGEARGPRRLPRPDHRPERCMPSDCAQDGHHIRRHAIPGISCESGSARSFPRTAPLPQPNRPATRTMRILSWRLVGANRDRLQPHRSKGIRVVRWKPPASIRDIAFGNGARCGLRFSNRDPATLSR